MKNSFAASPNILKIDGNELLITVFVHVVKNINKIFIFYIKSIKNLLKSFPDLFIHSF